MKSFLLLISGTPLTGKSTLTTALHNTLNNPSVILIDGDGAIKDQINKLSNGNPNPPYVDIVHGRINAKTKILQIAENNSVIFDIHMKTHEMLNFRNDCKIKNINFYAVHLKCSKHKKETRRKLRRKTTNQPSGVETRNWPEPKQLKKWDLIINTTHSKVADDIKKITSLLQKT